jgi:outer membrane protein
MKNISLILNAVLFVAVAVLYYLNFSGKKSNNNQSDVKAPSALKIAYINADTVLKYYEFVSENRTILEAKGRKLDQDLQNRAKSLQDEFAAYQRNVSNLTIGQAKAVEESLGKKEQNLRLFQQSVEQELMNDQAKMGATLRSKISDFLKSYAQGSNLEVVLKLDASSDVLYGNAGLDISKEVVKGLNEQYKLDQAAKKTTKSDSTKKGK